MINAEWMKPLVPLVFKAVLWDQGEADAKRTNSSWYSHEFPAMIRVRVPLCTYLYSAVL